MTTSVDQLALPSPPWLLRTVMDLSALEIRVPHKMLMRNVNGQAMSTVEGVLDEFGIALEFPNYYGKNSAALDECLRDLSWLPADGYVIVVTNSRHLLAREPPTELLWLMGLLEHVCEEWGSPIADGQPWDRPAISFHVVFQQDKNCGANLAGPISSLPELSCL